MPQIRLYIIIFGILSLAACNKGKQTMLPDSGGRPYEAILIGDKDSILYNVLTKSIEALPQAEPAFDVSMKPALNPTLRLARSIIIVDTDTRKKRTEVKYERNVYAEPQIIVYVSTPSTAQLQHDIQQKPSAEALCALLQHQETAIAMARLAHKHNPKLEAEVRRMFGIDMKIPADMQASRKGHNFIWISNDSPTTMTNICIYTSENRDSVMQANIKGETDAMYMTTTPNSVVTTTTANGNKPTIRRGLWEMHGDAMGGPFVQHIIKRSGNQTPIVAEAFVYAPGTKKRNLLFNTEAALYTIRIQTQQ